MKVFMLNRGVTANGIHAPESLAGLTPRQHAFAGVFRRCLLAALVCGPLTACSGGSGSSSATGGQSAMGTGGMGTGGTTTTVPGTGGSPEPAGSGGATVAGSGGAPGTGGGTVASGGATGSGGLAAGTGGASTGGSGGGAGRGGMGGGGGSSEGAAGGPATVDLFNGTDLTGFDVYRETQATSPGTLLTGADALKIFKVENGTVRVYGDAADKSTQARHTMMTKGSYSKYNLWWEYKWGTKKYAPYTDLTMYPRDAGVLWHIHNDRTQVWPSSIEFQNKDGTTGDIFALYARCTSLGLNGGTTFVEAAAGGTSKLVDGSTGFVQHGRSANFEIPDWNAMQLQVNGGSAVYIVNGHIVNRVLSVTDKTGKAITSGPIAWQAEHAEVFYRNMRIQVLP